MRHHVAFVVNNYPPHVGGVERHVQSLADSLIERGHRVTVITLSDTPGVALEKGVDVIRLPRWLPVASVLSFPRFRTTAKLRRLLRERSVTVVSVHTRFFPMTWIGVRAARRLGVPVVHTEHGSGFVRGTTPAIALASRLVDVTAGRWSLRRATRVLAVSEPVARFVERLGGVKAEVFPAAIDLESWITESDSSDEADPSAPSGSARFVFLGRMVPGKGWDSVLHAARALRSRGLAFTVDFIGDGPDLQRLSDEVESAETHGYLRVRGRLSGAALVDAMRGAVLVNPTTLAEGFQTSLLEALAAGGCVITYDVPGARTLHADGAPVRIVAGPGLEPLVDAMIETIEHPMPPYPRAKLDQWGWAARAADYERVLDQMVGSAA